MSVSLGEKIRQLRKTNNLSQEVLANILGVSFQAVSKWETGATMPDAAMLPAIASFFRVSMDELFDFNAMELEKQVEEICRESWEYRDADPAKAEEILREGLKRFPGNDIILNNLLYTMREPERSREVVELCKALVESTKKDDVKYDALRICAETYKDMGEYALVKSTLEQIPEIYFTRLELEAKLLDGEDMFFPAWAQKNQAARMLTDMLLRLVDYYEETNQPDKAVIQLEIAKNVILAMKEDFHRAGDSREFYDYYGKDALKTVEARIKGLE